MSQQLELPLKELCSAHPGLTSHQAGQRVEAARVTLSLHHAKSPVPFSLVENSADSGKGMIAWRKPSERMRRGHGNLHDRVEAGAECVSFAAMRALRGLVVKARLETGTGADWILGTPESPDDDFEDDVAIEVSGIDVVDRASLLSERLHEKVLQIRRGQASGGNALDGVAVVVGFSEVHILVQDVPNEAP